MREAVFIWTITVQMQRTQIMNNTMEAKAKGLLLAHRLALISIQSFVSGKSEAEWRFLGRRFMASSGVMKELCELVLVSSILFVVGVKELLGE
jgi:hypothetical protein